MSCVYRCRLHCERLSFLSWLLLLPPPPDESQISNQISQGRRTPGVRENGRRW